MPDRLYLLGFELAAHFEDDRSRRIRLVAGEQGTLGYNEVNPGELDPVDCPDRARELAFERSQLVDVLNERRGSKRIRLVENLVADAATLGQAVLGELHAEP